MTCAQARQVIGRYVTGLLSRGDSERLESHLCECGLCEAEFERLVGGELPAEPLMSPVPTGLRDTILSSILGQPHDVADLCYILAPQLSAYVDGELEPDETDEVSHHLAECSACARRLESMQSLHSTVTALPAYEPSARLKKRILAQIPQPARPGVLGRVAAAVRWRPLQLGLSVAATAMLALLATVPFWYGAQGRAPQERTGSEAVAIEPAPAAMTKDLASEERSTVAEATRSPDEPVAIAVASRSEIVEPVRRTARPTRVATRTSTSPRPSGITARGTGGAGPSELTDVRGPEPQPADAVLILPAQRSGSAVYHLASATRPERLADEPARLQLPSTSPREGTSGQPTPSLEPEEGSSVDVVLALDVVSDWQPSSPQNILVPASVYAYE